MNEATQILNTWVNIVKKIGGKRIKRLILSCCGHKDYNHSITTDTIEDAILLKDSNSMKFTTYNLKNRNVIIDTSISEISDLSYKEIDSKRYTITFFNGLYWRLNLEIA